MGEAFGGGCLKNYSHKLYHEKYKFSCNILYLYTDCNSMHILWLYDIYD